MVVPCQNADASQASEIAENECQAPPLLPAEHTVPLII